MSSQETQQGLQNETRKRGKPMQAEQASGFPLWAMESCCTGAPLVTAERALRSAPPRGREAWVSACQVLLFIDCGLLLVFNRLVLRACPIKGKTGSCRTNLPSDGNAGARVGGISVSGCCPLQLLLTSRKRQGRWEGHQQVSTTNWDRATNFRKSLLILLGTSRTL